MVLVEYLAIVLDIFAGSGMVNSLHCLLEICPQDSEDLGIGFKFGHSCLLEIDRFLANIWGNEGPGTRTSCA